MLHIGAGVLKHLFKYDADPKMVRFRYGADPLDFTDHQDRMPFFGEIQLNGDLFIYGKPVVGDQPQPALAKIHGLAGLKRPALLAIYGNSTSMTEYFSLILHFHNFFITKS
mgnify:CR=1 FL=1